MASPFFARQPQFSPVQNVNDNALNTPVFSGWLSLFVIDYRQAVERNVAAPFARQPRQFSDEFKPDLFMAPGTRRKNLSPEQRYFVGQAMLRMNHPVDSAFRDGV
jgi:hypothetical protein